MDLCRDRLPLRQGPATARLSLRHAGPLSAFEAIPLGNDAALGQLAGALNGASAIPDRWLHFPGLTRHHHRAGGSTSFHQCHVPRTELNYTLTTTPTTFIPDNTPPLPSVGIFWGLPNGAPSNRMRVIDTTALNGAEHLRCGHDPSARALRCFGGVASSARHWAHPGRPRA